MKRLIFLSIILASFISNAQLSKSVSRGSSKANQPIGIQIGLLTHAFEATLDTSYQNGSYREGVDRTLGVLIGYNRTNVKDLGFSGDLSYLVSERSSNKGELARLSGNLTYGISELFNLHGGGNISTVNGSMASYFNPAVGYQLGGGVRMNQHFAIDLSYVQVNTTVNASKMGMEGYIAFAGAELGVSYIF